MAYSHPLQGHPDAEALKKEAGKYVKRLREDAGITQADLAKVVGLKYYTLVSQVELGRNRLPPDKYEPWARAVGVSPHVFTKRLLQYYDPFTFNALFGKGSGRPDAD